MEDGRGGGPRQIQIDRDAPGLVPENSQSEEDADRGIQRLREQLEQILTRAATAPRPPPILPWARRAGEILDRRASGSIATPATPSSAKASSAAASQSAADRRAAGAEDFGLGTPGIMHHTIPY